MTARPPPSVAADVLEAAHVVALPAVERDGNRGEALEGRFGVHAQLRITRAGELIGLLGVLVFAHNHSSWVIDADGHSKLRTATLP